MANTRFQHKRSTVSGVTPTTSDIAAGELGLNLADRRIFTSNGSAVFELGSNLTNLSVSGAANITSALSSANLTTTTNVATFGTAAYFVANGNVGVGTAVPTYVLDVARANNTAALVRINQSEAPGTSTARSGLYLDKNSTNMFALTVDGGAGANGITYYEARTATGQHIFFTNSTERMRITAAGNVGIGTSTPGARLSVVGVTNSTVFAASGSNSSLIWQEFSTGGSPTNYLWNSNGALFFGTNSNNALILAANGAEALRVVANGNIGIGTSTPTSRLHVVGGSIVNGLATFLNGGSGEGAELNLLNPDNSTIGCYFDVGATDNPRIFSIRNNMNMVLGQLQGTGGVVTLHTEGTERARVSANGNVGIGNTDPDARLTVTGTANVSGNMVVGGSLNAANVTATTFTGSLTGTASNATNLDSQPGSFYTNASNISTGTLATARLPATVNVTTLNASTLVNTASVTVSANSLTVGTAVYVVANGNVGIGNTAPTQRLRVEGVISDASGDVRTLPVLTRAAVYTLAAADTGDIISTTANVTVNGALLSTGFVISVFNNSASNITIVSGAGAIMYLAGTASTGNRTLAQRGLATVTCVAANTFVVSGAGIS